MVECSSATLRQWEKQGLVLPRRSPSGFRLYDEQDLRTLRRVALLRRAHKLSLASIRRILQQSTEAPAAPDGTAPGLQLAVGPQLRQLRLEKRLTLQAVASGTGLSHSFISLFERGRSGITMATLRRLLQFYGTTLASLASNQAHYDLGWLTRAERRPTLSGQFTGVTIEQLSTMPGSLDPSLYTIEPGAGSDGSYRHEGEEFIFVLSGTFEILLGGATLYRLQEGDSLNFPSSVEHEWVNPCPESIRVLWINTPPTF